MTVDLATLFDPSAVDDETRAFNAELAAKLAELPPMHTLPPAVIRKARSEGRGALPLQGPAEGSEWVVIPGAPGGPARVRVSEPEGEAKGVYLHIHGGGWTIGQADHYDRPNQAIAKACGLKVVSVHYRLAPEHPWPAQREDCMAAARWVMKTTDLPVAIGGESAGGHLSAVTALGLRDEGFGDRVRGVVFNYGVFDLRMSPSAANWGETYLVLSTPIMEWFYDNVDPGAIYRGTPGLSPLLADLGDLPPALFQVGTADPLLDDTLFMAQRWQAAGNRTELAVYPGAVHGFDAFDMPSGRQGRQAQHDFLNACMG